MSASPALTSSVFGCRSVSSLQHVQCLLSADFGQRTAPLGVPARRPRRARPSGLPVSVVLGEANALFPLAYALELQQARSDIQVKSEELSVEETGPHSMTRWRPPRRVLP